MALLWAETTQSALVVVWFECDDNVFVSDDNRQAIESIDWKLYTENSKGRI